MFAFFFADQPVTNFTEVMASNTGLFKPFFHEAMKNGVYLPPSPYETCFISTAHSNGDMDRAIEILVAALKAI
jgi:glutamate-1-semialdehyde 2,1-aminomutase